MAVVVLADHAAPPTLADLTDFLAEKRMAKHFWPEGLIFVDDLPKTATGKVQKQQVREIAVAVRKSR